MPHAPQNQFGNPNDIAVVVAPLADSRIRDESVAEFARVLPDGTPLLVADANGILQGVYDDILGVLNVQRGNVFGTFGIQGEAIIFSGVPVLLGGAPAAFTSAALPTRGFGVIATQIFSNTPVNYFIEESADGGATFDITGTFVAGPGNPFKNISPLAGDTVRIRVQNRGAPQAVFRLFSHLRSES